MFVNEYYYNKILEAGGSIELQPCGLPVHLLNQLVFAGAYFTKPFSKYSAKFVLIVAAT